VGGKRATLHDHWRFPLEEAHKRCESLERYWGDLWPEIFTWLRSVGSNGDGETLYQVCSNLDDGLPPRDVWLQSKARLAA
jgi:hypothetical protein